MKRARQSPPPLIEGIQACTGRRGTYNQFKVLALVVTFWCYCLFHATRKPPSVVKSVLKGDKDFSSKDSFEADTPLNYGWGPFNGSNGQSLLGQVDLAFLAAYAAGMFFAGHMGDRTDLRVFLSIGMLGSGIFCCLFGMAYLWDIHSMWYFTSVMVVAGVFQSFGWPSVVSIMANWYGKGKRGLVMGIWNAHTSLGNILGTVVAAACLQYGWGYAFIVPGVLMSLLGLVVFAVLVVQPSDVGLGGSYEPVRVQRKRRLLQAWAIPGVSSFAFCLFFSKLIAYTFLYWLPYYIKSTPIEGRLLSAKQAGDLSTLFDVGGVAGGIMAGHLSDNFTLVSVPFLYLYRFYGNVSFVVNVVLMMACGFCVNGPYALITTAVSADLGTHESLAGNAKALATHGAAIGPMLTGYISEQGGFDGVFVMLYTAALLAGLLLVRLCLKELQTMKADRKLGMRVSSGVQLAAKAAQAVV
ncbi:glycerol-3-phosphate permease-like protein [Scenedesmus sp. NREL 46B-D3]|nr:glycerol-3-phosphate permease-like protein [Scenedesmus sp. NREL 46B-D3]